MRDFSSCVCEEVERITNFADLIHRLCGMACVKLCDDSNPEQQPNMAPNPRPDWAWPEKCAEVVHVTRDVCGLTRENKLIFRLEYNYILWESLRDGTRGLLDLGRVHVHGNVKTLHGEQTPVLDLESEANKMPLVIKFNSLNEMHDWWCLIVQTQQLVRQLKTELDDQNDDDEEEEEEESMMAHTPNGWNLDLACCLSGVVISRVRSRHDMQAREQRKTGEVDSRDLRTSYSFGDSKGIRTGTSG